MERNPQSDKTCIKVLQFIPYVMVKKNQLPLRSRTRHKCLHSLLKSNIILEVLTTAVRTQKEKIGIQIGNKDYEDCLNLQVVILCT